MFKQKFWLAVFGIYLLFSTALIATGMWPAFMIYANLAMMLAAVLFFDLEYALYSVILSIPFYLDVPDPKYDTVSLWRIVFLFFFLVFIFKIWRGRSFPGDHLSGFRQILRALRQNLFPWDKYLLAYALIALLSLAVAKFKFEGLKELVFALNIYLIYVIAASVIKTKEQVFRAIVVVFSSLASVVAIGFAQFIFSLAVPFFYFWQYWAIVIARAFYGSFFANTAMYSNSWIAFYPNQPPSLRMFSVLPDSHAFAVIALFGIPFALALLRFAKSKWQKTLLWIFIALSAWAILLSGTRGVWVGLAAPLCIGAYLWVKHYGRKIIAPAVAPVLIFAAILLVSPFLQKIISGSQRNYGNYLQRAESVSSLDNESNAARLDIWKKTLKFAARHPLLGAGYGNFIVSLGKSAGNYIRAADKNSKEFNLPQKYITAHDFYLQILAETGILGLLAFALFFKKLAGGFWNFFKRHFLYDRDGFAVFAVAAGLYLAALFVYLLVDTTIMNDRVLMYFFLILALCGSIFRIYETN